MPLILYTEEEYRNALTAAHSSAMALAQALCVAHNFPCIYGPGKTPCGPGEYCSGCPAVENCPAEFKKWAP